MSDHVIGQKPFKINVCVPTHEYCPALFAYDLAQMQALTASLMPPDEGHSIGLSMNVGTYIGKSRTELLEDSLSQGATHILWVDSDMRFPRDALIRLLKHRQPVVGINYSKRRMPAEFTAVKRVPPWDESGTDDMGEFLRTGPESEGLEEVDALGFGLVLMDAAPLYNLPDPKKESWFGFGMTHDGRLIGEDVYFCKAMLKEKLGLRIFVDHDLSWQCAHIGTMEYLCQHAALEWDEQMQAMQALKEATDGAGD